MFEKNVLEIVQRIVDTVYHTFKRDSLTQLKNGGRNAMDTPRTEPSSHDVNEKRH